MISAFICKRNFEFKVAMARKKERDKRAKTEIIIAGNSVFYCENCRSPVVETEQSRKDHAMRKPECRYAMQYKKPTI